MSKWLYISPIIRNSRGLKDILHSLCPGNIILRRGASGESCVREKLVVPVCDHPAVCPNKVTVVGTGNVGMACAFAILAQRYAHHVALVNVNEKVLQGEMLDLLHGSVFLDSARIQGDTDFAVSAGSKICIVTAGVRQKKDESRLSLVERNVEVFKKIIPALAKNCPDSILLIVTNPVDVMTYVSWKLSGFPRHRVIGSGTHLDTARFRLFIGNRLRVSAGSVQAWIIGEHGDSSVPVWSQASVGGVRLRDLYPALGTEHDKEKWCELHKCVISGAGTVIRLKGYTSWAVGLSVADLVGALLRNDRRVTAVSTFVKGLYDVECDVVVSLPVYLSSDGVSEIIKLKLADDEVKQFQKSAEVVNETMKTAISNLECT